MLFDLNTNCNNSGTLPSSSNTLASSNPLQNRPANSDHITAQSTINTANIPQNHQSSQDDISDESSIIWDIRQLFDLDIMPRQVSPYPRGDNSEIPNYNLTPENPIHGAGSLEESNNMNIYQQTNQNNIGENRRSNTCLKSLTRVIHDSNQVKDILFSCPPPTLPQKSSTNNNYNYGNDDVKTDIITNQPIGKLNMPENNQRVSFERQSRSKSRKKHHSRRYYSSSDSSSSSSSSSSASSRCSCNRKHKHYKSHRHNCCQPTPSCCNTSCCSQNQHINQCNNDQSNLNNSKVPSQPENPYQNPAAQFPPMNPYYGIYPPHMMPPNYNPYPEYIDNSYASMYQHLMPQLAPPMIAPPQYYDPSVQMTPQNPTQSIDMSDIVSRIQKLNNSINELNQNQ